MPVTIEKTEIKDLTRISLAGMVTVAELVETLDAYAKNGPTRLEIYDIEHLDGERFSTAEIDTLVGFLKGAPDRRPRGGKTAIVAAKTVDIGITRMISILSEGDVSFELEAFRSTEAAIAWLKAK